MCRLGFWCILLLAITSVLRPFVATAFPVLDEEAELRLLARNPALHAGEPPLPIWFVRLLLSIGGTGSKLELRSCALLTGAVSLVLTIVLARRLFGSRRVAAMSLLLALCLPVPACVGVVLGPDSLLLVLHLAFLRVFWTALQVGRRRDWVLTGMLAGAAVLCRFSAVTAVAASALYIGLSPPHRRWLTRAEPWFAVSGAALAMLPLIIWNDSHDWASLQRVCEFWSRARWPTPTRFGEVLFEQLCQTGVFLAGPFLAALVVWPKRVHGPWRTPVLFLSVQAWGVLAPIMILGPVFGSHPQSTLLAYSPIALMVAALAEAPHGPGGDRGLIRAALATKATLVAGSIGGVLVLPLVRSSEVAFLGPVWQSKIAAARRELLEWEDLARRLDPIAASSERPEPMWFVWGRKAQAILSFHRDEAVVDLSALAKSEPCACRPHLAACARRDGFLITTSGVEAGLVRRHGWFRAVHAPRTFRIGPVTRFIVWSVTEFRPDAVAPPPPRQRSIEAPGARTRSASRRAAGPCP